MNNCTVHYPAEDNELNLCGSVCTRDDPQTEGAEVTCLACIMAKDKKEAHDL